MADNFDIYDDKGTVLATDEPSPITIEDLEPNTTYSGWKIGLTGSENLSDIPEFKTKPVLVESFTIDPKDIAVETGSQATANLTFVRPTNATDKTFNVSVADDSVATVSISGTKLTITGVKAGDTTFTVTSNDGNVSNDGTITVTDPEPEDILVESFELDPTSLDMTTGDEEEVTITNVVPTDATNQQVAVFVEDNDVATAILNGNVIEVTTQGAGTTNMVVTTIDGSEVTDTLVITVTDPE